MEPLTAGAIAFTIWLGGKILDWSTDKAFDTASERVMQLLKQKSPDTAKALTAAAEREDIGEAVLVEEVKKAAATDPDIQAAVEALGQTVNQNPELEKQLTTVIENWKGINIKGGINTFNNSPITFN
ncbi:hypothetical protein Cylst_3053 [Cylindrospermum stagnale PCC 7417]|uniref:Uncharacterized protein n=1 Tax=Cylindrospermum stagnale PCC 7417 TaxID=56107 RepID=K9WZH9_9NOST|nr:hypothetical protein [Cylindrospermum stagnale]AFZ25224.1 hypothetical protein Cylst_3053 [Cylindrospermum stagnale PCC 7417]